MKKFHTQNPFDNFIAFITHAFSQGSFGAIAPQENEVWAANILSRSKKSRRYRFIIYPHKNADENIAAYDLYPVKLNNLANAKGGCGWVFFSKVKITVTVSAETDCTPDALIVHLEESSDYQYAIKFFILNSEINEDIRNEFAFLNEFNENYGALPPIMSEFIFPESEVVDYARCPIIIQKYNGTPLNKLFFLSIQEKYKIVKLLIEALQLIHQKNILHRDLKPDNMLVMMDKKGRVAKVTIIDFGLSVLISEDNLAPVNSHESWCGAYGYYTPQEILDDKPKGLSADIYSLAAVLAEFLGLNKKYERVPCGDLGVDGPLNDTLRNQQQSTALIVSQIVYALPLAITTEVKSNIDLYAHRLFDLLKTTSKAQPEERPSSQDFLNVIECILTTLTEHAVAPKQAACPHVPPQSSQLSDATVVKQGLFGALQRKARDAVMTRTIFPVFQYKR